MERARQYTLTSKTTDTILTITLDILAILDSRLLFYCCDMIVRCVHLYVKATY